MPTLMTILVEACTGINDFCTDSIGKKKKLRQQ